MFGETQHGDTLKFQSNNLFGHAPHLPTSVFASPAAGEFQKFGVDKDFRLTLGGLSKKTKLRMARLSAMNSNQPA